MSNSLLKIQLSAKARELEERRKKERRIGILSLIREYLTLNGFSETSHILEKESGLKNINLDIADNIDLEIVFRGYENYFTEKFGRRPKYVSIKKKPTSQRSQRMSYGKARSGNIRDIPQNSNQQTNIGKSRSGNIRNTKSEIPQNSRRRKRRKKKTEKKNETKNEEEEKSNIGKENSENLNFFSVQPIGKSKSKSKINDNNVEVDEVEVNKVEEIEEIKEGETNEFFEKRLLPPIPFRLGSDREYAESIQRDILSKNPGVYWDDIVGLNGAKRLVTEAVVLPIKYPSFFSGVLTPWKGVLLFGPPGTGKTMLAKAVATECKTTFFNISASSIVSKWRGDSEKLIRVLFELARHFAPSTIFLDEVDSILSQRRGNEHEASRRMKTELLIQMDGLAKEKNTHVFILGASNVPWDLDQAVLRRFEKRILVELPSPEARESIFKKVAGDRTNNEDMINWEEIVQKTEGFSGADIVVACKEAMMRPVRKILSKLESVDLTKSMDGFGQLLTEEAVKINQDDIFAAIDVTQPSGNRFDAKYKDWNRKFGAHTRVDNKD